MGRNTVEMLMTAPLPYLLISVKEIQVERVSLSDMQNFRTVCHPFALRKTWLDKCLKNPFFRTIRQVT